MPTATESDLAPPPVATRGGTHPLAEEDCAPPTSQPTAETDRGPTPPPNTPRRARSVSVTAGIIDAAAGRVARLATDQSAGDAVTGLPEPGNEDTDTEELEYADIPPGFVWPPARPYASVPTRRSPSPPAEAPAVTARVAQSPPPATPPQLPASGLSNTEPDRRSRKRARFESPSPTPPNGGRSGRLPRTSLALHARQATPAVSPVAPTAWRRPAPRIDRPAWLDPSDAVATQDRPPTIDRAWDATPVGGGDANRATPHAGSRPIPIIGPPRPARYNAENTPPEDLMFDMELDLPLMSPPSGGRTASEAGLPLSVLDFNRNRFPTALAPSGPINPDAFAAAWPDPSGPPPMSSLGSTTAVPSSGGTWEPASRRTGGVAHDAAALERPPTHLLL